MKAFIGWSQSPVVLGQRFGMLSGKTRLVATAGIDLIASEARDRLEELTPGDDLPKMWKIKKAGNAKMRKRTIENMDPRAYALVKTRDGRTTNLIEMLEFGTSHTAPIVPVKASFLSFVTKSGKRVFTRKVNHPGTRPYSMVRITTDEANAAMSRLTMEIAALLRKGAV